MYVFTSITSSFVPVLFSQFVVQKIHLLCVNCVCNKRSKSLVWICWGLCLFRSWKLLLSVAADHQKTTPRLVRWCSMMPCHDSKVSPDLSTDEIGRKVEWHEWPWRQVVDVCPIGDWCVWDCLGFVGIFAWNVVISCYFQTKGGGQLVEGYHSTTRFGLYFKNMTCWPPVVISPHVVVEDGWNAALERYLEVY